MTIEICWNAAALGEHSLRTGMILCSRQRWILSNISNDLRQFTEKKIYKPVTLPATFTSATKMFTYLCKC